MTPAENALSGIDIEPSKIKRLLRKAFWLFNVYLPAQHDSIVLTRNGKLMFNSKDKTTGRILHVYRNHEFKDMTETVHFLRDKHIIDNAPDGIVVDVGGYIGMSSTGFLLENLFEKSLSFEPSPENFRLLKENIKLNGLEDRLFAYNIALSDEVGTLEFELSDKNYGDNRVRETSEQGTYGEQERSVISIKADTFDKFLESDPDIETEKIKLIWMDIQGHEGRFIKGAHNFLKDNKHVPVVIEFWPYGIERSGVGKKDFLTTIYELFKSFYILGQFNEGVHEIKELDDYWDENLKGEDGLNILLIN